ncbi:MAG TPA: T9SS type A sorting domain-containing protein [Saprospiraceae bacterium]|nr:T9SS type A sorting domain-containing protein [Saprospiraceae bacterium]
MSLLSHSALSAQTILDFEAAATSTTFQYFGSSIDGQLTKTLPNPHPGGLNTSATVLEFKKPAGAQTWAGGFSNPNPATPVNVVTNTKISIKVHFDHIGNLTLKLENSADGGPNWVQTVANTKVNEWETLTFNVALPSIEGPNQPALGHIYKTITLFTDFGTSPTADGVGYLDDIRVEQNITCTTVLNFEAAATSTTFQYFGSSLEGQLTKTVANPNKSGIDTSATVLEFKKPANSQTWAGAFANPNSSKPVNLLTGGQIKIKFHTDHPGNLVLKLEEAQDGAPNWALKVPVGFTELNKWVELVFDPALPSFEGPNMPAVGHVYNKITLFADFDATFTTDQVYYIDDIEVCSSGGIPTADVTFKVDMNQYAGSYGKVYVSGSFNGWAGDKNELLDPDGDKVYELKLNLPVGLYEYKFTLDNWAQQEQFDPTTTCTKTTVDGSNIFVNRKLALSSNTTVGPVCFNSCYGCGQSVRITVNLGMGTYTPDPGGVYLAGGGDFGPPGGRFRMGDPDGDGVFSIRIERQRGYSTFYDFANGPCPDYSCKENLEGQSCAVPTNFNDRWLSAVQQDTVINTCFASCATNTACTSGSRDFPAFAEGWLSVQPSVATDALRLLFATAPVGKTHLRVFDAAGHLMLSETLAQAGDTHTISVASWPQGVYMVLVQSASVAASARVVKQ